MEPRLKADRTVEAYGQIAAQSWLTWSESSSWWPFLFGIIIVIIIVIMVALWNRADHYIFALWFLLLLSSSFFFPRLISAVAAWMSAILLHMVWP